MKTFRAMIAKRPWLLIVFFLGAVVLLSVVVVLIAVTHPPILIER